MIDPDFLKVLRCPESRQTLALAEGPMLTKLNEKIAAGTMQNRAGKQVERPCDGALVREDGKLAYAICAGIPVLLPDEALILS